MGFSRPITRAVVQHLNLWIRSCVRKWQACEANDSTSEALLANLTATEEQIHATIDVMEQEHEVAMT